MKYSVHITPAAERDLDRTMDYISLILKNPEAADRLLTEVEKQINSLSVFPKKCQVADDPVLSAWGIRFLVIKNHIAFYTLDDEKHLVIIVRFLFRKSNWNAILRQSSPLL